MASITRNVVAWLKHHNLFDAVKITRAEADRVFGWPVESRLLDYVVKNGWDSDPSWAALMQHGTKTSFREPNGVRPAMQVCFHTNHVDGEPRLFVEIDFDYASPSGGFTSFLTHASEVVSNTVARTKTDQSKIEAMLKKRGVSFAAPA